MKKLKSDSFEIVDSLKRSILNNEDPFMLNSTNSEASIHIDNDIGFLNKLFKNVSDFKDKIKFNLISMGNKLKLEEPQTVWLFDKAYEFPSDKDKLEQDINEIIWITYRNNISPIVYNNKLYTSDAGWGCMIRSGQMIMSRAIFHILKSTNVPDYHYNTILLFLDNDVKYTKLKDNPLFAYYKRQSKPEQLIDIRNTTHDEYECLTKEGGVQYITPPFSIRNIVSYSIESNKGAGDWFSNYDMCRILKQLNYKYKPLGSLKVLNFSEGTIYIDKIMKECFTIKECKCHNVLLIKDYFAIDEYCIKQEDEFIHIETKVINNPDCKCFENCYFHKGKYYEQLSQFVIFVSNRLGLDKLEECYYDSLLDYFKINNNIGLIGGRGSKALYFIGSFGKSFIYIDPHYVKENVTKISDKERLVINYRPSDLFYLDIKDMTPSISMGFVCTCIREFFNLVVQLQEFNVEYPILSIK
jgi:cysteine protease ATG4